MAREPEVPDAVSELRGIVVAYPESHHDEDVGVTTMGDARAITNYIDELTATIARLTTPPATEPKIETLTEALNDVDESIRARWCNEPDGSVHPANQRKYDRDKACLRDAETELEVLLKDYQTMQRAIARLEGDAKRLDYLDSCSVHEVVRLSGYMADGDSARHTIDAGMQAIAIVEAKHAPTPLASTTRQDD